MKWLLVWIVANVSGADLPERQIFETREQCEAAATVLNDLSKKSLSEVTVHVRAACIEVPADRDAG